ncbi:unnamed protein product [Peronospora belbahrii]|uniref:Uncharacterized protein n=1 Tax=Peronospora belbahrii TaxID=622444 RepID=A0AAU9LHP0_9STRA|nr:unnamed protein product [Peronospora belbahrii]
MGTDVTAYRGAVTGSEQDAWDALTRMGRPIWYTYAKNTESQAVVVMLAAKKLLLGQNPRSGGYKEGNMFGVASLLCRVGLRPYSTSPFASRAVADLMAVLAYVNFEKEGYVSSYASDPVLALGAIKVWYGLDDALSQFILPQLSKLILNEALDTGGIGEVVARIVLLLAMDKCAIGRECYTGQFLAVHSFLKAFGAEEMPVFTRQMREAPSNTKKAFWTWLSKWDGWQMSFTHFVQLKLEPTVETLWYLLGRRAAGIFPRNQKGADLLIPIFWKKNDSDAASKSETKSDDEADAKVSLILIQVNNHAPHDREFSKSVTTKLCPSFVFGQTIRKTRKSVKDSDNSLSKISVRDVICIHMCVQDEDNTHHRFIYAEKPKDINKKNDRSGAKSASTFSRTKQSTSKEEAEELRFTLCYRSVRCDTYKFLDVEVARRLKSLVKPLGNPLTLVNGDLQHRQEVEQSFKKDRRNAVMSQAMGEKELKKIACKGLTNLPGRQKASEKKDKML